ncbi:GNAT family N-acetyltransferase [Alicyclobacillus fastidiosus]|uniref:GNAT family N-acetyltransferase n=1 Tax=Alicyclobacillus fastidiosus TaxID=392011 RepID=A0ABV5AJ88_9BACL|nr:GNAT family N-acetyltransferase [Alicyclobacillus fastidiosus]WEH09108.1 GNAT family N-acetyltransferase [Alicyclobacillus fastidiosus]
MKLVEYRSATVPVSQVKRLLSYAVGAATEEKLSRILDREYSEQNINLYLSTDGTTALGIIGIKRLGYSAEILHIAVHELMRHQGIGRRMIDDIRGLEEFRELIAETDHESVEFYRACGFSIHSRGDQYPGVERYRCTLKL